MKLSEQLRDASAKATGGEWYVGAQNDAPFIIAGRPPALNNDYPCHDAPRICIAKPFDDEIGGLRADKDANARLVALMCSESHRNHIIKAVEAYERGPTPEQVREALNRANGALAAVIVDQGKLSALGWECVQGAKSDVDAAINALDLSKIGGE